MLVIPVTTILIVLIIHFVCWSLHYSSITINGSEWAQLGVELKHTSNSNLFLLLVLFISLGIVVYYGFYIVGELYFGIYSTIMLLFIISIVLLLMSNNWVTTLYGWEGLGISSFFLIYSSNSWESVNNALSTLLTIRIGDYCLFLLIGGLVVSSTENIVSFGVIPVESVWLTLMGLTKSAQFPFSGWLPKAISAPTPTSALVHSSTLITAGLIVLMTNHVFISSKEVLNVLYVLGIITIVGGSLSAMVESSAKKAVAFSTLSQVGASCISFGSGEFYVGYWLLVAHGVAKSLLFILIGYSIHGSINQQAVGKWNGAIHSGLFRVELLMTLISLIGTAYLNGIISKELLLECIQSLGECVVSKVLTVLIMYSTLYYCGVIWSFYFNISHIPVGLYQSSISILILSIPHSFVTVGWFSWSGINWIIVPTGFQYIETLIPVVIISGLALSAPLILWSGFPHYALQILSVLIITLQYYVWAQPLLISFSFIEGLMNSVVLLGCRTLNLLSLKATWQGSGSTANLLVLMLIVMLILL